MPLIEFANDEARRAYEAAETPSERVALAFDGIMRHLPEAQKHLIAVKAATKHSGTLSQRLVELVRIRTAYWTQCRPCMTIRFEECLEDGLDQEAICALERPESTEDLSEAERAAIRYADKFANDWLSIDKKEFDALRKHFTEAEIVQLGLICALHLGTGRLTASYAITEDLPEAMQGESEQGKFKPWEVNIDYLVMPPLPDEQSSEMAPTLTNKLEPA